MELKSQIREGPNGWAAEAHHPRRPSAMRAWVLSRTGSAAALTLSDVPSPEPGPGQVAVRVEAIGINYAEVLSRKGLYGWAPKRPYVPGMEAVGTIETLGLGVSDRQVGERVICGMQYGAYAERLVIPANRPLPAFTNFSLEENAAFAVNFLTAWVALMEMARLRSTDRVGITAAAGGVGTAAVSPSLTFDVSGSGGGVGPGGSSSAPVVTGTGGGLGISDFENSPAM